MSRLAQLLGHDHPLFVYNLAQLEKATGHAGVDTKLIADCDEKAHAIMRELGLDPANTLLPEVYKALEASVERGEAERLLADSDYVLTIFDGEPLSFNIQDVIENAHHELPAGEHTSEHARRHLRAEIICRYAEHDRTHDELVHALAEEAGLKPDKDTGHQPLQKGSNMENSNTPRILAVGDIISSAFIKLSEEFFEQTTDEKGYTRLSFELGAKIPYDSVQIVEAVECSPNAAVSLSRLGLNADLMAWIGNDDPGRGMVQYLNSQNVGTDAIVVEDGMKSNYHYVLRYGADRTKLQRFEDYSYKWEDPKDQPDWLYLGVLGKDTWPLHEAMLDYLNRNPSVKLVFQPGMYHLMWGSEKLAAFYERAEIVILNREEAAQVTGVDRGSVPELISAMHGLGVTVVVITDGASGAYASDGQKSLFMPNYPDPAPPLDRTGAGDAFASTITAALAYGESLETALAWAPINSMNVCQAMGAQAGLQTREQINEWLDKAPEDYKVSEL